MNDKDWREARRAAVTAQAAALERQRAKESARAQELIDDFVREMRDRGVEPQALRARVPGRRTTYRTGAVGWYLRANRSLAVGTHGEFYILDVPPGWKARFSGAEISPSDPPLIVGRGARDGESIDLAELLRRRLAKSR